MENQRHTRRASPVQHEIDAVNVRDVGWVVHNSTENDMSQRNDKRVHELDFGIHRWFVGSMKVGLYRELFLASRNDHELLDRGTETDRAK